MQRLHRNVIVQAGHIGIFSKGRVQLSDIQRSLHAALGLKNFWNRDFRKSSRMMVDASAPEKGGPIVVLPERDEDGRFASGGWKSEDGKLSCGYSSFRGKRTTMEDFYDIKTLKIDEQTVYLFGIFDGHGGSRAAEYLKEHLFENLMKHPQFITDTKSAICAFKLSDSLFSRNCEAAILCDCRISLAAGVLMQDPILVDMFSNNICLIQAEANVFKSLSTLVHSVWVPAWDAFPPPDLGETYQQTDADFLDSERDTYRDDGSTASTAVLVGNHLYVANVGDSRAVVSKAGKAIPLSEDHKPNRSDERKRIESAGGVVMWAGTWRVGGVLAMSRAFGNRMLKQFVVAEPEIQDQEIDKEFELLVLASDGLWDVVPNEDAVSLARTEKDPEAAARKLTEVAFTRGSADNITCIVVKFLHDTADPASPQHD